MTTQIPQELIQKPIRYYIKEKKRMFIIGVLTLGATNVLDNITPFLIGKAIDLLAQKAPTSEVLKMIGLIFGVTVMLALTRYSWRLSWGKFSHTSAMDLQNKIFSKFTHLGQSYLKRTPVGELMSIIINDTQAFRMAVGPGILIILDSIFILIIVVPIMVSISLSWTLKTLILMPLLPFFAKKIMDLLETYYEKKQTKFAELSGFSQEIISGMRVIKSYGQQRDHTRLFNRFSRDYETVSNKTALLDASFAPPLEFAVTCGCVILLIVGIPDVMSGAITVGSLFTFYQYIQRMEWPATAIGLGISHIQQGHASFRRVRQLFQIPDEVIDSGDQTIEKFETLRVVELSHQYEASRYSVKNINFELQAGEILGVIGPTASGKSTLIDLLARIINPTSGEILVNGRPIQEIKIKSLRGMVTVVPQESFLFSDKVAENISLGAEINHQQIEAFAKAVELADEIRSFPIQYDTFLGERGINLSGGQRQRLTLARALARQTPLILIDDSLSAVDAQTEEKILKQLRSLLTTAVVISHRVESVRWAHKILVLRDGEQEAIGTHDELLKISPTYKNLYQLQKEGSHESPPPIH
jgi:ATP-binding cassette, subfamily B, multidrug efflux pump